MIRMIATDLDDTLLAGKCCLPQENLDALRRAMDAGVYVVIASGRMPEATFPIAEKIGVNAPLVLFNGAMTYDMKARRVIDGVTIPCARAREVLKFAEDAGMYIQAFPGSGYYYARRSPLTDYYEEKIEVIGQETGVPLSEWLDSDVYKLLCLGTFAETKALQKRLIERFPDLDFIKSGEKHLEVVAKNVDKALGLKSVCRYLNLTADEVMAFGDEQNDIPMLLYAGAGYIMANAADSLKRGIRYVAPRNTECGVAAVVNMYLNENRMGG